MGPLNITMHRNGGYHIGEIDVRDRIVFPDSDYVMMCSSDPGNTAYQRFELLDKNDMVNPLVRFTALAGLSGHSDETKRVHEMINGLNAVRVIADNKLSELKGIREKIDGLDIRHGIDDVIDLDEEETYSLGEGRNLRIIHPWDAANYWGFTLSGLGDGHSDTVYTKDDGSLSRVSTICSDWVEVKSGTLKEALAGYVDKQIGIYEDVCDKINFDKETPKERQIPDSVKKIMDVKLDDEDDQRSDMGLGE